MKGELCALGSFPQTERSTQGSQGTKLQGDVHMV